MNKRTEIALDKLRRADPHLSTLRSLAQLVRGGKQSQLGKDFEAVRYSLFEALENGDSHEVVLGWVNAVEAAGENLKGALSMNQVASFKVAMAGIRKVVGA